MKISRAIVLLGLTCLVSVCVSCSRAAHPSKETTDAIEALHKVQAATQVGVNYQQYGQLLIDAKAKTNAAARSLADGDLKTEMNATMDAYADASHVWGMKIEGHLLYRDYETLIAKYSIPMKDGKSDFAKPDAALQFIWLNADSHLKEIAKLLDHQ